MNTNSAARWTVLVVCVGVLLVFFADELDGMLALGQFITASIQGIPGFIEAIVAYYGEVERGQLLPSLGIGGGLGALLTMWFLLGWDDVVVLPPLSMPWLGLLVMLGGLLVGMRLWVSLGLGTVCLLVVSAVREPRFRAFFSWGTPRAIVDRDGLATLGRGLLIGGLVGVVGSQLLTYPLQHCTYKGGISPLQRDLGIILTAVGALVVLLPVWTLLSGRIKKLGSGTAGYFRGHSFPYIALLPTLLILVIFLYYPSIEMLLISSEAKLFGLPQTQFVCLDNYITIANDAAYQNSLVTTAYITVALVVLTMTIALGIAQLASLKIKYAGVYRTLLIWPFALSPVVTGVIFLAMFRDGQNGVINYLVTTHTPFAADFAWIRDPALAPWVIIAASVWNALGFNILFYIAGLQNVPDDLLEAAAIDGANVVTRFLRVTLPMLSPFTFFLLVTNVTYAFYGIYGVVDATTQGGPGLGPGGIEGGATNVLIYKLYEDGFSSGGVLGQAAAQAVILFLMVAVFTVLQFQYVERRVTYSQ